MSDHCGPFCPFAGCSTCKFKGGESVSDTTGLRSECATMEVRKTAPDQCANTAEGLTTQTAEESKWL